MAYLDNDGLLYFWQQIKTKFATKAAVDERLNGKADATHTHAIADTTGLQAALDGKAAVGHKHVIADVDGLQAALDSKANTNGYYTTLAAGAADALMVDPSESTWSRRTSTGSGMARVESVQGAAVVWNQLALTNGAATTRWGLTTTMDPSTGIVTIAGTATQSGNLNSIGVANTQGHKYLIFGNSSDASMVRFSSQSYGSDDGNGVIITNHSANKKWYYTFQVQAGAVDQAINVTLRPQVYDLTAMFGAGNEPTTVAEFERMFPESYYPYSEPTLLPVRISGIQSTDAQGDDLDSVEWTAQTLRAAGSVRDELTADELVTRVGERAYQSGDESDATVRTDGTTTYYPLTTPTTTPISPALPMSYKVEQGGTESIIVPAGEISAAPVLTVAEGESAGELVMDALACIATPDGPTATANHAVNTYLTMQGKLYKVTRAIAVGETITHNTNVTETTVMAEVLSLIQ